LWAVHDRATAELMSGFYAATLQRGLSPAAALREAQLCNNPLGRQTAAWSANPIQR
jgi:CHAT domain-containing protein